MRSDQDASAALRSERSAVAISRNTHDIENDHFGVLSDAQIASGTPAAGEVPVSNGDGTRTWGGGGGRFPMASSAPSSPAEGDAYYDTTTHVLRVYDGTGWQDCW